MGTTTRSRDAEGRHGTSSHRLGVATKARRHESPLKGFVISCFRGLFLTVVVGVLPGVISRAQDTNSVLDAASRALGTTALQSIEYSGTGATFPIGQAYGPGKPWPRFRMTAYTATIDLDAPAMRESLTRVDEENPPRGGGAGPYVEATGQGSIRPIPFGPQIQNR